MPFQGLPGDEKVNAACHLKNFHNIYGTNADARTLYIAQPIWTRFAPLFPRVAYLLDSLNWIYSVLDVTLVQFRNAYVLHGDGHGPGGSNEPPRLTAPQCKSWDPFEYFSGFINEDEQRACLLHLRWALRRTRNTQFEHLFRECAHDLIDSARSEDRKLIMDELLSAETANELNFVPVDMDNGIWAVRRQISWREAMLDDALRRIREALDATALVSTAVRYEVDDRISTGAPEHGVEYGAEPIIGSEPIRTTRFAESPHRSMSPPASYRGRHREYYHNRSRSRESMVSSVAPSSVTTWAPEEPDQGSLSMRVWSSVQEQWVEGVAVMDTGCEGGNFISSLFLEQVLKMGAEIEEDPDADRLQWVDFGGNTDFKPKGKVRLKWYGRNIQSGRKGKRSITSEDWFRVAPHLPSEDGEEPFQILLGKDWLHENEVITYRGLRLFKSKNKKQSSAQEEAELQRRRILRQEAEIERLADRLAAYSPSLGPGGFANQSPKSSVQSLASLAQSNGTSGNSSGTDTHGMP